VIAEPIERRSSKRFTVEADRADVVVDFDGADHRAVMSDMSATGFGLLLLKGSRVAPGDKVQLTDSETETTFELEVVHVRPEDDFQYVGLRRISDETRFSIPLFRFAGKTYTLKMPGISPLIFLVVVFGFSGSAISMLKFLDTAGSAAKQTPNSVHEQAIIDARQRISPEEKRRRILARTQRYADNRLGGRQDLDLTPSFWERITGPNREQVGRLVGGRNISWSQLVFRLDLSKTQQDRIQDLLHSDDPGKDEAARTQMMTLLTAEQRSTLHQMLATLPLN
jgi:hypothetical protein